jgi:peptidoglycan/xylan/chitin deacetylase (PgdA/CDA1 family)
LRFTLLYHTPPLRVYFPPRPHTLYQTKTGEGLAMRRDADREERNARLLAGVVLAAMLVMLSGIIHLLYHREYAETDTPNDCFAVSAATGETALPKIVCLTFDDGPSKNTRPILEILDKEQVPATFFVCAQDANEKYLPLVADIAAAGHQIALHSATHQYSKIYASTDAFWQDIRTLRQALEPYVDVAAIDWLRFPGGSTNTVSHRYGGNGIMKALKAQAEDKGYHWIDWNVCAEDATASHPDAAQILRNIRRDADGQDTCVVLLHDTKATSQTVKALPDMIAYFREQGYNFCTVAQMDALQCETK